MPPTLRQSAGRAIASGSRVCTVTLTEPTVELNLVVVVGVFVHEGSVTPNITGPSGFTLIRQRTANEITAAVWYRQACPALTSVSVAIENGRSIQMRVLEYAGAAQASALDKVTVLSQARSSSQPYTGTSGNTAQADSVVLAFVINRYASTAQSGFTGGLARLADQVTPSTDSDDWRSRLTVHTKIATAISSFVLSALLSCARDWIAILITFRGGSSGPARLTAINGGNAIDTNQGTGALTVFGPLRGVLAGSGVKVGSGQARIGPFNYQYRLNGWNGLLIGSGTRFYVEGTEGLYGWQVRTSDDDLPRGDGALRGVDLESARQVLFKLNVGRGRDEVEQNMIRLFAALVPQREEDWELIWRHPGQPLKMLRCRPIDLLRDRDSTQLMIASQSFVLRAADPRHYAAIPTSVIVPVTTNPSSPVYATLQNLGNAPAYPRITVDGPTSGPPVTRVELINVNGLHVFDARMTLPKGGQLVGDMEAHVTGAPRSIITLDGQTKYGAWQLPREPFRLEPGPVVDSGVNALYLQTEPPGAPVTCTLDYRDTWSG